MASQFGRSLSLMKDLVSFPAEIGVTTHLSPEEIMESLKSITVPRFLPAMLSGNRKARFKGWVLGDRAMLRLSRKADPGTDLIVVIELCWDREAKDQTTVNATVRISGQGPILVALLVAIIGAVLAHFAFPETAGMAFVALFVLALLTTIFFKFRLPLPRRELHIVAEELADALDIGYREVCEQNPDVLK